MIDRLARALEHIEEIPKMAQEELADFLERYYQEENLQASQTRSFAGVWGDLPDDMEETLLRWRHEAPPTPPIDEQLDWLEEK